MLHVGTGVEGSALKLAVNAWMTAATVAMSDVLALCDALGIDHATFVTALEAGPLAMPYELQKVRSMDAGAYNAGFAVAARVEGHRPRGGAGCPESPARASSATVLSAPSPQDMAAMTSRQSTISERVSRRPAAGLTTQPTIPPRGGGPRQLWVAVSVAVRSVYQLLTECPNNESYPVL